MTSNVNHWSYPFAGDAGNPLANLTSLAKARGGYYPMGASGLWHGGVHFDQGTAVTFDQSSVRCIADGEVIAYRIDEQYPISEYIGEIPLIKRALFSTGFVLVRHRLALPPLHPTPGSDASEPALTFYSLYMHLQDWAGYQAQASLPRPDFWGEGTYCVETQGSDLNVRAEPSQSASILAALPKGTRVRVGASNGQFRKLLSIVSGAARPALAPAAGEGTLPGYLAFKFLKAQSEPKAKGSVVVLDQPAPIKAGDLIGHLGRYQNHDEAMPQSLLHLEVFSCEDVPAFVAQSRAYASRLPETQKTLLKIYKGASKLIPHREGIDADNPPRLSDEGVMVGVDLVLPQSLLDSLPADAKLVVPASTGGMSCNPETRWWRLDNLLVDKDGQPISGWLAEQEMITTRHSPWEWEGYDFIEDRERPAGALAYHLEALRRLTDSERASYKGLIDQSDKGPVKQRLYAILDGNGDQKITPEEISTALGKPWHAQSIAQLITKHESEWFWNPDKWDELDELMEHSPADPNPDWAEEKKRIEKLSWWKELGGRHGVNADGVVWHFHPLSLITPSNVDVRELKVRAFLRMIRVGEGTLGGSGYEKLFGGSSFIKDHGKTFGDHPQIKINKSGYTSSAAGAYQVMGYTWSDVSVVRFRRKLGILDFTPQSQDKLCVALLKFKVRGDALGLIVAGEIKKAIENCSWEWASLPPGRYGQPIETMEQALKNYEKFLREETDGVSDLHLIPGFLREFGYQ
ncbi:hypothetical protein ACGFZ6_20900 [Stutzerimonas stutzeri]|uniref:hypothetical protein n=1 Tax=Stutzerimonas stutzeri TaxID=316 RepID=UPI003714D9FC